MPLSYILEMAYSMLCRSGHNILIFKKFSYCPNINSSAQCQHGAGATCQRTRGCPSIMVKLLLVWATRTSRYLPLLLPALAYKCVLSSHWGVCRIPSLQNPFPLEVPFTKKTEAQRPQVERSHHHSMWGSTEPGTY